MGNHQEIIWQSINPPQLPAEDSEIHTTPDRQDSRNLPQQSRLGDRSTSLDMQRFNASTIREICKRLPYYIQDKTYGIKEEGRDKLKKVITKADKRATDKNDLASKSLPATSKVNITQITATAEVSTPTNSSLARASADMAPFRF